LCHFKLFLEWNLSLLTDVGDYHVVSPSMGYSHEYMEIEKLRDQITIC